MGSWIRSPRLPWTALLGSGLLVAAATTTGCQPSNPNVGQVEKPIITDDAPKSSEEAAAQSEPPPIQYKRKPR